MRTPAIRGARKIHDPLSKVEPDREEKAEPQATPRDSGMRPIAPQEIDRQAEDAGAWLLRELFGPAQEVADADILEVEDGGETEIEDEDIIGSRRVLMLMREIDD